MTGERQRSCLSFWCQFDFENGATSNEMVQKEKVSRPLYSDGLESFVIQAEQLVKSPFSAYESKGREFESLAPDDNLKIIAPYQSSL
jgi:hypothetical protein